MLKRKHGEESFHRWVGWGVIANNLTQIGRNLTKNHNGIRLGSRRDTAVLRIFFSKRIRS